MKYVKEIVLKVKQAFAKHIYKRRYEKPTKGFKEASHIEKSYKFYNKTVFLSDEVVAIGENSWSYENKKGQGARVNEVGYCCYATLLGGTKTTTSQYLELVHYATSNNILVPLLSNVICPIIDLI